MVLIARIVAALTPALVAGAVLAAPAASTESCSGADARLAQVGGQRVESATLCLLNIERERRGRRPLRADRALAGAADAFARRMVRERFFNHVAPGGSTVASRVRATSYLQGASGWALAENIAWGGGELGTPRAIVQAWMHSSSHRQNILDGSLTDIGIGVVNGAPVAGARGMTYVTDFGRRGA